MRNYIDQTVKVNKQQLLETLRVNRAQHVKDYDAAVKVYRRKAEDQLRLHADIIASGGKVDLRFDLVAPVEYAQEFDQAIAALEWHTEDELELDWSTFRNWVLNDWDWKTQFQAATTSYLG